MRWRFCFCVSRLRLGLRVSFRLKATAADYSTATLQLRENAIVGPATKCLGKQQSR